MNLDVLKPTDQIKFVIASRGDWDRAESTIREYRLDDRFQCLVSGVFGQVTSIANWSAGCSNRASIAFVFSFSCRICLASIEAWRLTKASGRSTFYRGATFPPTSFLVVRYAPDAALPVMERSHVASRVRETTLETHRLAAGGRVRPAALGIRVRDAPFATTGSPV